MSALRSEAERTQAIAELAYRFWEERGCPEGSPDEDWYKIELNIDREQDPEAGNKKSLFWLHKGKRDKKRKGQYGRGIFEGTEVLIPGKAFRSNISWMRYSLIRHQ